VADFTTTLLRSFTHTNTTKPTFTSSSTTTDNHLFPRPSANYVRLPPNHAKYHHCSCSRHILCQRLSVPPHLSCRPSSQVQAPVSGQAAQFYYPQARWPLHCPHQNRLPGTRRTCPARGYEDRRGCRHQRRRRLGIVCWAGESPCLLPQCQMHVWLLLLKRVVVMVIDFFTNSSAPPRCQYILPGHDHHHDACRSSVACLGTSPGRPAVDRPADISRFECPSERMPGAGRDFTRV
jgi:hypothetical protein